ALLSVVSQILFIIIVMVGALGGQSISSNIAVSKMQQHRKTIYDNTAAISLQDSIDEQHAVARLRVQHLAVLSGEAVGASCSPLNLNVLSNKINARKNIDDPTSKQLDETFANIRAIMDQPVSPQHYHALSRAVDNLHNALRFIRNTTA